MQEGGECLHEEDENSFQLHRNESIVLGAASTTVAHSQCIGVSRDEDLQRCMICKMIFLNEDLKDAWHRKGMMIDLGGFGHSSARNLEMRRKALCVLDL